MTHDYHDGLPGYHPDQLLHDGCAECEARSTHTDGGLQYLDAANFRRAWARAATLGQHGIPNAAAVEGPMLRILWGVQVQLERLGWPLGCLPGRESHVPHD